MIYTHDAESPEGRDLQSKISKTSSMCACGSLLKGVSYSPSQKPSPKGLEISLHLYMCIHKSKNKMLSFLFLDSDFILRRSILYSLRIQFNSPIEDEENINMYDKRDYFNNPLVTDLADLLENRFTEIVMDGEVTPTSFRTRIMMMLWNMDSTNTITENPLKGPTTTTGE